MKNKLLVISILAILAFTGCGKNNTEAVVPEAVEEIKEVEPIEETEIVEDISEDSTTVDDVQGTIEKADLVDGTSLTQEELDKLNAEATTDAQKEALDAYETITKEGSWTDAYGVTYTEVVGKPDGSWRRMTDAEAEKTLETADPVNDINYFLADAELKGKDWVEYDTVTGKIYYDPYEYAPVLEATVEESRAKSGDEDIVSEEEIRQILGDEAAKELFGI